MLARAVCQFYGVPFLDSLGRRNFDRFTAREVEHALLELEVEKEVHADNAPLAPEDNPFGDIKGPLG